MEFEDNAQKLVELGSIRKVQRSKLANTIDIMGPHVLKVDRTFSAPWQDRASLPRAIRPNPFDVRNGLIQTIHGSPEANYVIEPSVVVVFPIMARGRTE